MKSQNKKYLFAEYILLIYPIALLFSNFVAEIFLFFIVVIFCSSKKNLNVIIKDKIFLYFLIFFFYLIINYFINYHNNPSANRTFGFIRFPLLIISVAYLIKFNYVSLKKIFYGWTVIFLIIIIDLIFQKIYGVNLIGYKAVTEGATMRLGGFMNDELKISNLINHFCMLLIGYYFFLSIKNKFLAYSNIAILLSLVVIVVVFLTGERSNFITIICAVLIFFLFRYGIKKIVYVILILLPIAFLFDFQKNPLTERMFLSIEKQFKNEKKIEGKNFFYKSNNYYAHYSVAYQMFQINPIFGRGINTFRKDCDKNHDIYSKMVHPDHRFRMCTTHPHSFYLEILSQLGIVGLIMIVVFFFIFFIICFKLFLLDKKNYLLLAGCIILLCYFLPIPRGSFFTNWTAMIFWLTFAFVYSQLLNNKQKDIN